jgi:arylsulfatase A-like enzyme
MNKDINVNRRLFLKNTLKISVAIILSPSFSRYVAAERLINSDITKRSPNVILIISDDLGIGDLGCYGCKDIPTPYIDKLAKRGLKFTQFYAASPVCTPSRGSLLTGLYPQRLGLDKALMGEGGYSADFKILAQRFKTSGYATGCIGKWHLGYTDKLSPTNRGFDEFFGHRGGKIDYFKHTDSAQEINGNQDGKHDLYEGMSEVFRKGYSTNLFTDRAVNFITNHKDKPFFLYLSYNAPHYASPGVLQAPPEYIKKFGDPGNPTSRQIYSAMVSCMDDGIGRIIATLDELKITKDTIILFMSDNGADLEHGGSNTPFKDGKTSLWEGGLRVPLVVVWQGQISQGSVFNEIAHAIDICPTLLAACSISTEDQLDGLNLLNYIKNKQQLPERDIYFSYSFPTHGDQIAVRNGKWKYVFINGLSHLYDMEKNPLETNDLIGTYSDVADRMRKRYENWIRRISK